MDNLLQLLRWRALNQPDQTAYTVLFDGEAVGSRLTYAALDRRVRALAAQLEQLNAAGERVLLLYPPGLEYIIAYFACLHAGAVAVPLYPPRHSRHLARVQAIASDAHPQFALTTKKLLSQTATMLDAEPELARIYLIAGDSVPEELADKWTGIEIERNSPAHLQYTSGSTATPKGVMVTHGNLMHNSEYIARGFAHSPASISLTWLPHFHDMGLLDGIIQPLYSGFPSFLMSPTTFLQQPYLWLQAISRFRVTHSGGPNFAYDLCVRSISEAQITTLDLGSWRVAYNGAEPVRAESLERFAARFASCGFRRSAFYPAYGLAEATLKVTGGSCAEEAVFLVTQSDALKQNRAVEVTADDPQATTLVSVGRPALGTSVRIVNPETRRECAGNQIGEIWIAGPSVANGYWNRPEETEETFHAYLADNSEGPFLRSGDLGFFKDDELYVTGRLKELIIIRGLNHYPQDIELTVDTSNPFLRPGCGAAFSIEVEDEERLVVVQELGRRQPPDFATVIADVRRAIAEQHELQAYAVVLVRLGAVPKTSSGKIQRRACRAAFLAGELNVVAGDVLAAETHETAHIFINREMLLALDPDQRAGVLESYLLANSARVLKVNEEQLNVQSSLTSFGLDSLGAVELKNRVETDLQVHLSIGTLLEGCGVSQVAADLLQQLQGQAEESPRPTTITDGESEYQLSATQQALWFLQQLAPESTAYNVAVAMRATSSLDAAIVRQTVRTLIQRHDSLRTTFGLREDQPIQKVHAASDVYFEEIDGLSWDDVELRRQLLEVAHRPFDLTNGPVVRAYLVQVGPAESIFMLNAHHLVLDGWSCWLLLKEFRELYLAHLRGETAPSSPRGTRYADFVRWQQELLLSPAGERMWSYWQRELSGELPVVRLFSGRPQVTTQSLAGASYYFQLQGELVRGLRSLAQAEGVTLYTVLLAAFQILLQRYTAQDDILVGSPVAARTRAEFSDVVGCFFNAVVLRADFSSDPTLKEFLQQMRARVVGALEHQDYPSHVLTQRLREERDHGRRQLFHVSFIMQKLSGLDEDLQTAPRSQAMDLCWRPLVLERKGARAELELELIEAESSIEALLQYSTDLCDATAAARMAQHYTNLLSSILTEPDVRVSQLALLNETERQQLLTLNPAPKDYSHPICVHELFNRQAAKTPGRIVAVDAQGTITYCDLNAQADQLANIIRGLTR